MPERKYTVQDNSADIAAIVDRIAEKGFTPLADHFGPWVIEKSGATFATAKERNAAILGAQYALALRMEHQKSPENHEFKAQRRSEAENEATERAAASAERKAAKAAETKAARPAAKAAPAKPARAAAKATPAAKAEAAPAARPTRRAAATAAAPKRPARRAAKAEAAF